MNLLLLWLGYTLFLAGVFGAITSSLDLWLWALVLGLVGVIAAFVRAGRGE